MRTWWIVRVGGKPTILSNLFSFSEHESSIGPFWTYREAMQMLHRWD